MEEFDVSSKIKEKYMSLQLLLINFVHEHLKDFYILFNSFELQEFKEIKCGVTKMKQIVEL